MFGVRQIQVFIDTYDVRINLPEGCSPEFWEQMRPETEAVALQEAAKQTPLPIAQLAKPKVAWRRHGVSTVRWSGTVWHCTAEQLHTA